MICPNCNNEVVDGSAVCPNCTAPLMQSAVESPVEEVPIQEVQAVPELVSQQASVGTGLAPEFSKWHQTWMAIVAFVMGILGLITWIFPYFGVVFAVIGLVFGILGIKTSKKVFAIIGTVLISTSLLVSLLVMTGTIRQSGIGTNLLELPSNASVTVSKSGSLAFANGDWDALLLPSVDTNLAKVSRAFLVGVYGIDGTMDKSQVSSVDDISDSTRDMFDIVLSGGEKLWAVNLKNGGAQPTAMVMNMAVEEGGVSTKFDVKKTGNTLEAPSTSIVAAAQPVVTEMIKLLPDYDFKLLKNVKFSTSKEMYDLETASGGGVYVVRPDGYSQITIGEYDKSGNNSMSIIIMLKEGKVVTAGIAPFYRKSAL